MSPENNGQTIQQEDLAIEKQTFTVSASPHVRCNETIPKIMWNVNAALAPAALYSVFHFGIGALINMVVGIISCMVFEYAWEKFLHKKNTAFDGSACLTGLLLAMTVSPLVPAYMIVVGAFFAIIIAKQSMGGLGYNIFNPAHVGRAALMVSWPVAMTTWSPLTTTVDVVSGATPLNILKMQGYDQLIATFGSQSNLYSAMFLGTRNGSMGETSALLLILGGLYLIYKGYISWQVPICMIATVGIVTFLCGQDPIFHMLAGGLIIGAFFMATDMVTAPITLKGQIIFAVGAGLITVLIRLKGGYPEGVCYSILLMNAVTPLIDRLVKPEIFGSKVKGAK